MALCCHKHSLPSEDKARALVKTLIRPELSRSEAAINNQNLARIHPQLLEICDRAYKSIARSGGQLTDYQEHFNSLPRVVLDCVFVIKLFLSLNITCFVIVCILLSLKRKILPSCWSNKSKFVNRSRVKLGICRARVVGRLRLLFVLLVISFASCLGDPIFLWKKIWP